MARRSLVDPDDPRAIAWRKAQDLAGGNRAVSRHFSISSPAVAQWKTCPPERVLDIEKLSGVSRHELRPDVFGAFPTDPPGERHYDKDMTIPQTLTAYGKRMLAEDLGVSETEIEGWDSVPPTMVLKVEKLTGMSRHRLRPDVFGDGRAETVAA